MSNTAAWLKDNARFHTLQQICDLTGLDQTDAIAMLKRYNLRTAGTSRGPVAVPTHSDDWLRKHCEGKTVAEVTRITGMAPSSVYHRFKKAGISFKRISGAKRAKPPVNRKKNQSSLDNDLVHQFLRRKR